MGVIGLLIVLEGMCNAELLFIENTSVTEKIRMLEAMKTLSDFFIRYSPFKS
ncbi:hypothetical protein J2Z48_003056 [Croceifilum oryzae]|uniref:Uncharacterized protein n=1 Tax=Croceifilum oryzae TaxID=1553429 RepID=A0AAJ1TN12_9BACL|nr:hypothetical protein [Croceifilum oryzae]